MFRTLKKTVAIIVTLVFALSLMPNFALAEATEPTMVTVNFINGAVTRGSSGSMNATDTQNFHWTLGDYYGSPVLTTGNSYRGFAQMDFTGYEAILNTPGTSINYNVVAGAFSGSFLRDLRAIIQPGSVDDAYDAETMTYTIANGLGMLNTADKPVLFIENDGVDTERGDVINSAADLSALKTALNEDYDDSVITLYFESLGSGDNSIRLSKESGIQITYNESDVDNQAYVNSLAQGLTWDKISADPSDAVVNNITLPAKYLGADVTWTSSNPDALNAETGVVTPAKAAANVTLTANLTYNGVIGEEAAATATLNVTVPAKPMSKVTVDDTKVLYKRWTRGGSHEETFQGVPQYGDYTVHNSPTWLPNDRQTYFKVDLAGFEKYINAAKNVNFTLTGSDRQSTAGTMEVTLLSAKNDTAWDKDTITYKTTTTTGMQNEAGYFSYEFPISQNVNFSSAELAATLKQELQDNPGNSTITLRFNGAKGYTSEMKLHHPVLTLEIEYYEDELSDEGFINDIKGKLDWKHISGQDPALIFENIKLPAKYFGFPVTWASSNESVIATDGTVNVSDTTRYDVTLTATINYGTSTETKVFDLTVPKKMVTLEHLYDGSTALGNVGEVSTVEANGIGGKAPTDSYIAYANVTNNYYGHPDSTANGKDDIFEFSALVPEGSDGLHFYLGIFGTSGQQDGTRMTLPFTVKTDGIYFGFTSESSKVIDLDGTKWNNYTFVMPKGMTGAVDSDGNPVDDDDWEIYVNGELVFERGGAQITNGGLAYIRFYSYSESIDEPIIYLDNVRAYSGEYVPEYDTLSSVNTDYGIIDDKLIVNGDDTVADVVADITVDDDAVIRVYDAEGALVTDYTLPAIGNKLVIADRNGTTLERSYLVYEIAGNGGKDIIVGTPDIAYAHGSLTGKISVYNSTDIDVNYQVYLAVYNGDELSKISPVTLTVKAGETATAIAKLSSPESSKAKLIVCADDGVTPVILPCLYN